MSPEDRQAIRQPSAEEAQEKWRRRLERDEQRILVSWLTLQEEASLLVFDWSRTDRRTTNRKGIPDFRIFLGGRVLFGEMKLPGGKLSPDQVEMAEKFSRTGCGVEVWASAQEGIARIKLWLKR
jgi:hypothetical protein